MTQPEPAPAGGPPQGPAAPPADPAAMILSRQYRALLVLAAIVGLVVSAASWLFLEAVHQIEVGVYQDLPDALGWDTAPTWWPLPWLALAGLVTGIVIARLPGRGGHEPAEGISTSSKPLGPIDLPGVVLAATATLGLGLVLGPEAPLIAVGTGLAILLMDVVRKDAPSQAIALMAAAGSFAAISTVFGSPVIGAIIIVEAAGIGGPTMALVLLPGLAAAGVGSMVFVGLGSWSGLSTSAWSLSAFPLPAYERPDPSDLGWTVVLSVGTAIVVWVIVRIAKALMLLLHRNRVPLTVLFALAVGGLAIAFAQITDEPVNTVLFSGEDAFDDLWTQAATISTSTLALLLLFKGLAWSISLAGFRGGPTFPALFLGAVGGLIVADLPGFSETPAVAVLIAAASVAVLRLPLSAVVLATLLTISSGLGVTPLIVIAVVIAYLVVLGLDRVVDARRGGADASAPAPGTAPAG